MVLHQGLFSWKNVFGEATDNIASGPIFASQIGSRVTAFFRVTTNTCTSFPDHLSEMSCVFTKLPSRIIVARIFIIPGLHSLIGASKSQGYVFAIWPIRMLEKALGTIDSLVHVLRCKICNSLIPYQRTYLVKNPDLIMIV